MLFFEQLPQCSYSVKCSYFLESFYEDKYVNFAYVLNEWPRISMCLKTFKAMEN